MTSKRAFNNPANLSECHEAGIAGAVLMVIQPNGAESPVGRIFYCSQDGWDNRMGHKSSKPVRCYEIITVQLTPECQIKESEVRSLFNRQAPTYWLSSAYHLTQDKSGAWKTMRGEKGVPYLDEENVIPAVKSLQRFREFYPTPTYSNDQASRDDRPKHQETKKPDPVEDYKSKAAGDDDEEDMVSFV